jgi:hypothetical protein
MRIFERWYFGVCWNLRLIIELWYLEGFWFLLKDFFKGFFFGRFFFCMVKYLKFLNSSFRLKILFNNVNGKATTWHTPCYIPLQVALLHSSYLSMARQKLENCKNFTWFVCGHSELGCAVHRIMIQILPTPAKNILWVVVDQRFGKSVLPSKHKSLNFFFELQE